MKVLIEDVYLLAAPKADQEVCAVPCPYSNYKSSSFDIFSLCRYR